jgi:tetratricopeptide (TPR) repeat protein
VLGWVALAEGDYEEAGQTPQKVMAPLPESASEAESQGPRARALAVCGGAARGLGNYPQARQHLVEALEIVVQIREFYTLLHVMPIIPVVLADEDDAGLKERAAELHGLCMSQPFLAHAQLFEDIAWRHIRAATASLPPEVAAAAQERGRALDWWETAEALLNELDW